jgi:CheY-like chemotaxis protein
VQKLLYVENEDNLYILQLRFNVLGARDGAAGIAMAASERLDLILKDLNLQGSTAGRQRAASKPTRRRLCCSIAYPR